MAVISFIGAGNMARAIAQGLIQQGTPADQILMTGPRAEHLAGLAAELKVRTSTDNRAAASEAATSAWVIDSPTIWSASA